MRRRSSWLVSRSCSALVIRCSSKPCEPSPTSWIRSVRSPAAALRTMARPSSLRPLGLARRLKRLPLLGQMDGPRGNNNQQRVSQSGGRQHIEQFAKRSLGRRPQDRELLEQLVQQLDGCLALTDSWRCTGPAQNQAASPAAGRFPGRPWQPRRWPVPWRHATRREPWCGAARGRSAAPAPARSAVRTP